MPEIRKLGGPLGAEVRGLDPHRPMEPAVVAWLEAAFVEHLVLRFRDAPLSPAELRDFSRNLGELQPHVAKDYRHPDIPEIVIMTNQDDKGNFDKVGAGRGVGWHSDGAFEQVPAKATLLHALAVPSRGGNTMFANMYLAYDTMPQALKRRVEDLQAFFRLRGRQHHTQGIVAANDVRKMTDVIHPVIRVHPVSGRKSVYANPLHTLAIVGLSREDSDALLDELFEWCSREEFQWQQEWRVADTIIWENRSAWHSANTDYPKDEARKFYRTSVRGTPMPTRMPAAASAEEPAHAS
jgi:taurine dioxygenase